ncbi:MAG: nitronate monooxygenase [Solirubrobacterales bacterium]
MSRLLESLARPIVQAPMGGGPSTPELAAAVAGAGGLGFLAAGYKSAWALAADVAATRALSDRFGVNLFVPGPRADPEAYAPYVERLRADADRLGAEVGEARWSDDEWGAKLELLRSEPVAVVSFTFGCPEAAVVAAVKEAGSEAWITVTTPAEARTAAAAGADALIVQGHEAGAHQGTFDDAGAGEALGLLALLQLVAAETELPLIASGGIATGAGLAAVLAAGARAAQIGTAFLLCPEAGTSEPHRRAVATGGATELTRAFTGRRARGIVNRFLREHPQAPSAYPEVHYATAPIRAAARQQGDAEAINLWAGQAHALAREEPAAEVLARLDREARQALEAAARRADS